MYGTYRQMNTGRRSISPEVLLYRRPESPEILPQVFGKSNGHPYWLENCWSEKETNLRDLPTYF